MRRPCRQIAFSAWCAGAFALLAASSAVRAELVVTNAQVVNISPSGFSVFFRTDETADATISVFADAAGSQSLQGLLGVEAWPVQTGDPTSTNRHDYRLSRLALQQKMLDKGLHFFRVTDCFPATTYYFRISASTNAFATSTVWPDGGALATARTAEINHFVPDARQLVVEVPGTTVEGNVGVLEHEGAFYPLAAVVGDAAAPNQLYFNLSDLFAADGGSNLMLSGSENFTITVYGALRDTPLARDYAMVIGTNLVVAQADGLIADAEYVYVDIGETNVLSSAGHAYVPISVISSPRARSIDVEVTMDGEPFTNLAVSAQHPSVGSATMTPLGNNRYRIELVAVDGQSIYNTTLRETTVAHLEFGMNPLQRTVQVPVHIANLALVDQTNRLFSSGVLLDGAILVLARHRPGEWPDVSDSLKSFTLHGVPGTNYVVEFSTDLVQGGWSNWFDVNMGASNLSTTVDLPVTNAPVLFLRVREKP